MKCRRCGADLLDTDTFCVKCGQRVDQPMVCLSCGETLRDGELFCHKCGTAVESAREDDEIPLNNQRTVDIPFDEIEQGILLEAEQAIVKRPGTGRTERRSTEGYERPGTREAEYERPEYERPERPRRQEAPMRQDTPRRKDAPRRRYEERYEDYDDEDSGDSKMKVLTIVLGIIVVAIGLVIGFIIWQRRTPDDGQLGETVEQEEGETGEGDEEMSGDVQGRIQILSNVNVRNKPTTEGSEVLMVARTGEIYEYYELVNDAWYHIKLEDGAEGYVSQKYVEDLQ